MRNVTAWEVEPRMVLDLAHDALADPTGVDPAFAGRRTRVLAVTRVARHVTVWVKERSFVVPSDHVLVMVGDEDGNAV